MGQKLQIIAVLLLFAACLISGGVAQEGEGVTIIPDTTGTATPGQTDPQSTADPGNPTTPGETNPQSTADPGNPTTPGGTNSQPTGDPENPTTPGGTNSQPTGDPENPTTPGGTNSQPTGDPENPTTQVQPATTIPSNPCDKKPCGRGSTCAPRGGEDFVCLCVVGDLYDETTKTCEPAEVFPGELNMPGIEYKPEMSDTTSAEFQTTAKTIEDELGGVFKSTEGFSAATVVKIEPISQTSRVWSKSKETVKATVGIIFKPDSKTTAETIKGQIEKAAEDKDSPLSGTDFTTAEQCDLDPCDTVSMTCNKADKSFTCECNKGYITTTISDRLCVACPSGFQAESNKCIKCSYGYSGFNCNESSQLVLVIVGSVLGGLLLITLIILPVVALKSSKKSSKKSKEKKKEEKSLPPQPSAKAPLVNSNSNLANSHAAPSNRPANGFANAGVPKIPRATTSSWDRGTSLEMTPSNSRQNLVPSGRNTRVYEDFDDMPPYSQSRPQSIYAQARPQTNPYSQPRAQNPYGSSQGHTNPYFTNDDGRRY